jgi:hypothetical protein
VGARGQASPAVSDLALASAPSVLGGAVPAGLPDAVWSGAVHQVAPGRVLLRIPGLARAVVDARGETTIEADPDADPRDLRWLLDRAVQEVRNLLAGRLMLRAATVAIDGGAVALIGEGASGKSVTAATLALRGHTVLSDHRLDLDIRERAQALPTAGDVDLWPDAVELLGLPRDRGSVVRPALAKRAYRFPMAEAAPLALVVELCQVADVGKPRPMSLPGGEAIECLHAATVAGVLLEPLGLCPAHFRWMVAIAKSADLVRLEVDRDRRDPYEVADAVEALVR